MSYAFQTHTKFKPKLIAACHEEQSQKIRMENFRNQPKASNADDVIATVVEPCRLFIWLDTLINNN